GSPQIKLYTVPLVSFMDQVAQFGSENLFERKRCFSNNSNFDFPLTKRCCYFQANETTADDDRAFRAFGFLDDTPAVSESSQITNMRQIAAGNREANGLRTSSY